MNKKNIKFIAESGSGMKDEDYDIVESAKFNKDEVVIEIGSVQKSVSFL